MNDNPIPEGFHTVTPYLIVPDVSAELDFIERALGGVVTERVPTPDGTLMHGEVRIGNSMVMLGQANEHHPPLPCMLYLYVADVDAAYRQAVDAGAESLREPVDEFYGDRTAGVGDAAGVQWWLATRIETLSSEELARRGAEFAEKG
jgi:PhnB protein